MIRFSAYTSMYQHLPPASERPQYRPPQRTREEEEAREKRRQIAEETLKDISNVRSLLRHLLLSSSTHLGVLFILL